jgi:hypothetical protein
MKTIYTEAGKIVISDNVLSDIEEAVQEARKLACKRSWRPAIEIDIPDANESEKLTIVRVGYDFGIKDNHFERLSRFLLGKDVSLEVSVDLGCYGYEGWQTFIEHEDVRNLPDVHFTLYFIYDIIDPWAGLPDLSQVEKEHWKMLAVKLAQEAREYLEELDEEDYEKALRKKNFMERVIETSEGFGRQEKGLEDLISFLESKREINP